MAKDNKTSGSAGKSFGDTAKISQDVQSFRAKRDVLRQDPPEDYKIKKGK